jgi:hypothetical protein
VVELRGEFGNPEEGERSLLEDGTKGLGHRRLVRPSFCHSELQTVHIRKQLRLLVVTNYRNPINLIVNLTASIVNCRLSISVNS